LNDDTVLLSPADELVPPEEIYTRYKDTFVPHLRELLHNSPEFVWLAGKWFPRSLLVEINEGQLNIAEAILDMNGGGPLPTEALLPELGMPAEVNRALQIFSLNQALFTDERFDEVGPAGEVLWFLNRLEPAEVINTPPWLQYVPLEVQHGVVTLDLVRAERAIDDELSQLPAPDEPVDEVTYTLLYPHRRSGTVPLSPTIASCSLPGARTVLLPVEDARTGKRWPGCGARAQLRLSG
jgi:hypothetical protein